MPGLRSGHALGVWLLRLSLLLAALLLQVPTGIAATNPGPDPDLADFENPWAFDDSPLERPIEHPDWFKMSFLDLREDLTEAEEAGKLGIILYFGQEHCPYCEALIKLDWGREDIASYTREHFDVIALDIHGTRDVVEFSGQALSEAAYSRALGIDFTPYLIFIDVHGHVALKLRGFYPPYRFRAALEYVTSGLYHDESFRDYLARADVPLQFEEGALNYEDFFPTPPHVLTRAKVQGERPLAVFFERPDCHACDVLHTSVLNRPDIRGRLIKDFDLAQIDLEADSPVLSPGGEYTTARLWADRLHLFYTPTIVFFDEFGEEIIRIDSVVQFYRLGMVLDYIEGGYYLAYPNYQDWLRARAAGHVM